VNDTLANNASYAYYGDSSGTDANWWPRIDNAIVYFNNGGGGNAQYYSAQGWDPEDFVSTSYLVQYSCWQNLGSGDPSSTDDDPEFVDAANGNWHLSCDSSACIDQGDNTPRIDLPRTDIDGQDRTQPAETGESSIVDMGADELVTDSCD
jgi:hypothetical protein